MKRTFLQFATIFCSAFLIVGHGTLSAQQTTAAEKGKKPGARSTNGPTAKPAAAAKAAAGGITSGRAAEKETAAIDKIPARPDQLKYPELQYDPPNPADYRVQLKSGPVAYVVTNRELPLINIAILVRTGQYVEPDGKQGLSSLAGYLLARGGTKSKTAEELEERLAFLAAQLSSGVGETQGSVSLNLLSKDLDEGLGILREVLTAPRFQDDKIALIKSQTLQSIRQRNDDSSDIEERERGFLAQGEKFWANRYTTAASLESITKKDLQEFHQRWFHPTNFVVAVSGDFEPAKMTAKLEQLFAKWPFTGDVPPEIPTNTELAKPGIYVVNKDVNQGRVAIMLPGIHREDPDYFPAILMNDILGGGGFTSHIMNRVRSDEGLAYSASSSLPGGVYYPLTFNASFQSKSRTVPYAISIVLDEMKKMAQQPPAKDELHISKRSFIDRFPRTFATKTQVATTFAQEEFTGRYKKDPLFWDKYRDRIDGVTQEDVQRVAKQFLTSTNLVVLIVGQKEEILKGHPNHPVKIEEIGNGKVTELPLRDPLTMQPMKN